MRNLPQKSTRQSFIRYVATYVLQGVISIIHFQIERSFDNEKNATMESEKHFCEEAAKI